MAIWDCDIEQLQGRTERYRPLLDAKPVRYADALRRWAGDASFRSFFLSLLSGSALANYRWETPPIAEETSQNPFEFVLIPAPELACAADPAAFAEHFLQPHGASDIAVAANLGGDALLVIPFPSGAHDACADLASFVRGGPDSQRHALWQAVGRAMQSRLGRDPLWLSTAGAGVAWLHVRIDRRPKYYAYVPYRSYP